MPTARNARGIDLVAYSHDAIRMLAIQIKALSKRDPVPLGNSTDKIMGVFWIIANKVISATPSIYIMLPEEVCGLARRTEKHGRIAYWLEPKSYDQPEFKDRWDRIGFG